MTAGVVLFQHREERLVCPEPRLFTPRLSAPGSCSGNLSSVLYTHGSYELAGLCGASIVSNCRCSWLS